MWPLSPTVLHILNGCPVALNQLRYTWRHDVCSRNLMHLWDPSSLLKRCYILTSQFWKLGKPRFHNSIQPFGNNSKTRHGQHMQQHCGPHWTNNPLQLTRVSKQGTKQKTNQVTLSTTLSDLDSMGKQATLVTIELGHLATIFHHAASPLQEHYRAHLKIQDMWPFFDSAARTAISASYAIFLSRKNSHWMSDRMLLTWNVRLSLLTCKY